jgi:CheY-like chemotaxis protein
MRTIGKNILYAEDDPDDVAIFKMAYDKVGLPYVLHFVEDGQAAVDWLSGTGAFADRAQFPVPDLLILDLKMPRKTGFDVLEWVRKESEFKKMRILIVSSSDEPRDLNRAYHLGVTAYFVKSVSFREVMEHLRSAS